MAKSKKNKNNDQKNKNKNGQPTENPTLDEGGTPDVTPDDPVTDTPPLDGAPDKSAADEIADVQRVINKKDAEIKALIEKNKELEEAAESDEKDDEITALKKKNEALENAAAASQARKPPKADPLKTLDFDVANEDTIMVKLDRLGPVSIAVSQGRSDSSKNIILKPGYNPIPGHVWNEIKDNPGVRKWLNKDATDIKGGKTGGKVLQMMRPQTEVAEAEATKDLKNFKAPESIKMVDDTNDIIVLERWEKVEERPTVLAAVKAQIAKLTS